MSNLVVLCNEHHLDVHTKRLTITGWKDQLGQRELIYEFPDTSTSSSSSTLTKPDKGVSGRKKLSNENIEWVKRLVNTEKLSRKIVLKKLKDEKDIKISLATLSKYLKQ